MCLRVTGPQLLRAKKSPFGVETGTPDRGEAPEWAHRTGLCPYERFPLLFQKDWGTHWVENPTLTRKWKRRGVQAPGALSGGSVIGEVLGHLVLPR